MPCTTILVGKKASHDGSTIIARNDDGGFEAKRLLAHSAREKASTYKTVISHLTVELRERHALYRLPQCDKDQRRMACPAASMRPTWP